MNRILFLSLIIAIATAIFFKLQSDNRLLRATNAENRVSALETAVIERDKMIEERDKLIEINSRADEENEQFKGRMNEDTSDNLDVVPADYILKQLRAD